MRLTGRNAPNSPLRGRFAIAAGLAVCASALGAASAQAVPPENTAPPTISGNAVEGQTLTGDVGTWEGPNLSFTLQWQRSNGLGGYADIAGADGATYVLTAADVGHTIRLRVTATDNQDEATTAFSEPTSTVAPLPPVNTSPPTISGIAVEGQTLTGTNGSWSGDDLVFSRQWQRSDGTGGWDDIVGETGTTYTLTFADVGHQIRFVVTASNGGGADTAVSVPTATVTMADPENLSPPTISGDLVEGETLTGTGGSWDGSQLTFAYQWQRSDGASYENILGATDTTYTLTADDVGHTIRLRVRATNSGGSDTAFSAPTATVFAPQNVERSLGLLVKRRLNAYKRATIRVEGVALPPLRLWVYENLRGTDCAGSPAERRRRTRMLIDGVSVEGDFDEQRRPRMKNPGRHAFCAYLGPDEDTATMTSFATRKVRKPLLKASRAQKAVATALRRHGFADRVVAQLQETCVRRNRSAFDCRFSSVFTGYRLTGAGSVALKRRLSYRFQVFAQGRSFVLTD
jgi:hypothetical protein